MTCAARGFGLPGRPGRIQEMHLTRPMSGRFFGSAQAWVLQDGRAFGLGLLLEAQGMMQGRLPFRSSRNAVCKPEKGATRISI